MAILNSAVVNGPLTINGTANVKVLRVGKKNISVLSGTIANNQYSQSLVSASQVVSYIQSSPGVVTNTTTTQTGASASLSGTTITLTKSLAPIISTAGWVSSGNGTAANVSLSGTVPTETKTASAAGNITPTSGKLLSKVTVGSGSVTPGASYATLSSAGSSPTSVTSRYFKITPTANVGTAGWVSSVSNGTTQNYTVQAASTSSNNTSYSITSDGWITTRTFNANIPVYDYR